MIMIDTYPETLFSYGFDAKTFVELIKQLDVIEQPMITFDFDKVGELNNTDHDNNTDHEFTAEQEKEIFMKAYPDIIHMANSFINERAQEYINLHPNEFGDATQIHGVSRFR